MKDPRASRQSFLGKEAQRQFAATRIGVLGLGGGGSHIVQQLSHVGFSRMALCDPDRVEETNLNRLIGATNEDVLSKARKVDVAARLARGINPSSAPEVMFGRWEEFGEALRSADLIFGCLDGYGARRDLEEFTRRYMIPLIDIGLDVHAPVRDAAPQMSGQVIVSMPGGPCMWCVGFLNDVVLRREAERYGDAGSRPQVVWGNGVLASAAVGIAVDIITGWTRAAPPIFLELDANALTLRAPDRLKHYPLDRPCARCDPAHIDGYGDPVLAKR